MEEKMKKIVINNTYGGFGLSNKAIKRLKVLGYDREKIENDIIPEKSGLRRSIKRDDPLLVQVVEELGKESNGECADLKIVEIPNDVEWQIEEYDGNEWIAEKHRTWYAVDK